MIATKAENLSSYENLGADFVQALAFAETLTERPVGRYEYSDSIFAFVQEGTTKDFRTGRFEAHRKYLDIQIILEGEEEVVVQKLDKLTIAGAFDEDNDVGFYTGDGECQKMQAGDAYIAFPEDGHMPCVHSTEPHRYRKIVVKVPVCNLIR